VLSQQAESQKTMTPEELASAPPITEEKARVLRYPLSLLVRPELLKSLQEHAIPSTGGGLFGMGHVPKDAASLYESTKNEFLRRMGATAASSDETDPNADPFAQSRKSNSGFSEGRSRPLGGRRK
jgi:hypothetical protein